MTSKDRSFCAACGVDADVVWITTAGASSYEEPRCANCGFVFEQEAEVIESKTLPPPVPQRPLFGRVAVVDDSDSVRSAVSDALKANRLAKQVEPFVDGASFLSGLGVAWASRTPFELAVLDLHMPVLDGLKTAAALRKLERDARREATPILFLSSVACDQRLLEKLTALGPGSYLNKGQIRSREDLPVRLGAVLGRLRKRAAAPAR